MICEKCKKKEATIFYEETINGVKRSYSICSDCAAELEQAGEISLSHNLFSLPSFGSFHDGLFGGLFGSSAAQLQTRKTCPKCGAAMSDLKKAGKVGCSHCYSTFGEELRDTIRSIHGNVKHVGRAPARFLENREKSDRLSLLRHRLKEAIAKEDFEQAATLRDEIRSLENQEGGNK